MARVIRLRQDMQLTRTEPIWRPWGFSAWLMHRLQ